MFLIIKKIIAKFYNQSSSDTSSNDSTFILVNIQQCVEINRCHKLKCEVEKCVLKMLHLN